MSKHIRRIYIYSKNMHWRIMWNKKWWNYELYRREFWGLGIRQLSQAQGQAKMKTTPLAGDTFEIIYSRRIVGRGVIVDGFAEPTSTNNRNMNHRCNIGNPSHRVVNSMALLNITELLVVDTAPRVEQGWSQRQTWRMVRE
jgi:hypothetical protein